jgi:CrcB protein
VLAAVAVGGMIGASARHGLARWIPVEAGRVPWATLTANLLGSFLLGVVLAVLAGRFPAHRHARPFLASGVLGGFTTMSTYQVETALLVRDGHKTTAAAYVLVSVAGGVGLAAVGLAGGRWAGGPRMRRRPRAGAVDPGGRR